jgi:hypothetical protein
MLVLSGMQCRQWTDFFLLTHCLDLHPVGWNVVLCSAFCDFSLCVASASPGCETSRGAIQTVTWFSAFTVSMHLSVSCSGS